MLRKVLNYLLVAAACVLILIAGFTLGFQSGKNQESNNRIHSQTVQQGSSDSASSTPDLSNFWEAWNLINERYLAAGEVSEEQKIRGAVAGLVSSLEDPYSEYFAPDSAEDFRVEVNGNFGGIGAQLNTRDGRLTVVSPLKDSPAEDAGLEAGDWIQFVNSSSTLNLSTEDAVKIIRGPVNTSVTLTVMRNEWSEPREITIVRKNIVLPTLDLEMRDGGIAYIQLYQFNASANRLFLDAIRTAALRGTRGVVLDLRGNPGGFLSSAVNLASWFLPRGTIVVSQQEREGTDPDVLRANGNSALERIPVVVLIDEGSASASEILAGALRDQRKIPLVGKTSYGKGTVQEIQNLEDGSVIKLTVAHWVLPSGHILEGAGLEPDYEVEITEEDAEAGRDPQLEKALEIMRNALN